MKLTDQAARDGSTHWVNGYLHDRVYNPDGYCLVCNWHRNWLRRVIQRLTVAYYRLVRRNSAAGEEWDES